MYWYVPSAECRPMYTVHALHCSAVGIMYSVQSSVTCALYMPCCTHLPFRGHDSLKPRSCQQDCAASHAQTGERAIHTIVRARSDCSTCKDNVPYCPISCAHYKVAYPVVKCVRHCVTSCMHVCDAVRSTA